MSDDHTFPRLLTIGEVASILHVSKLTIRRWLKANAFVAPIRPVRHGSRMLFLESDILDWIARRGQP